MSTRLDHLSEGGSGHSLQVERDGSSKSVCWLLLLAKGGKITNGAPTKTSNLTAMKTHTHTGRPIKSKGVQQEASPPSLPKSTSCQSSTRTENRKPSATWLMTIIIYWNDSWSRKPQTGAQPTNSNSNEKRPPRSMDQCQSPYQTIRDGWSISSIKANTRFKMATVRATGLSLQSILCLYILPRKKKNKSTTFSF